MFGPFNIIPVNRTDGTLLRTTTVVLFRGGFSEVDPWYTPYTTPEESCMRRSNASDARNPETVCILLWRHVLHGFG